MKVQKVVPTAKQVHKSDEGLTMGEDGKPIHDDLWLHEDMISGEEEKSQLRHIRTLMGQYRGTAEKKVEKAEQLIIDIPIPTELVIDLSKATLNTAKLVRRPVQVKGKNGKVFTRMQWVDPRTGEPVSHSGHHVDAEEPMTKKKFIDEKIKNMSTEEKYSLMDKHNIKHDHNPHPSIDHKNKVVALKNHMYKNPHLMGASHLPDDTEHTPDGTNKVNDWINQFSKDDPKLYELLKKFGIADTDPRHNTQDKSAPIKHMHNMMKLKAYLKDNPHVMEDEGNQSAGKPAPKPDSKKPSTVAERGGNTISGVLKTMSDDELYTLMRTHGISTTDPRLDKDDKSAPIKHMHNMMKLKKLIEQDPTILNRLGVIVPDEEKPKTPSEEGSKFISGLSKEMKLDLIKRYKDHPTMKGRSHSSDTNIDYMHSVTALKKLFTEEPDLMDAHRKDAENEHLMSYKVGNKAMAKVLRAALGLKGVGDVKSIEDGVEWAYATGFVRREKDNEGTPILSVVDQGKDGDKWDEHVVTMADAKKILEGGEATEPEPPKVPLHEQPLSVISQKLDEDFKGNYTHEVGKVLSPHCMDIWQNMSRSYDPSVYANVLGIKTDTFNHLLHAWGSGLDETGSVPVDSRNFKKFIYDSKIGKYDNNGNDFIFKGEGGFVDPFPLHESARSWSDEDRTSARKDLIHSSIEVPEEDRIGTHEHEERVDKLKHHIHSSLSHVPFDLFTHIMANGCRIRFPTVDVLGRPLTNSHFATAHNAIEMNHKYYKSNMLYNDHVQEHQPGGSYTMSNVMSHEFSHAMDNFLSKGNGYSQWDNELGRKYVDEKHLNCIADSYRKSVENSNPDKIIGKSSANGYLFHRDNWISSYEGRIYDSTYYLPHQVKHKILADGQMVDRAFAPGKNSTGVEHWAENSARYSEARIAHQKWCEDNGNVPFDKWCDKGHYRHQYPSTSVGDYTPNDAEMAWAYVEMKKRYPGLHSAMTQMLDRGDFREDN